MPTEVFNPIGCSFKLVILIGIGLEVQINVKEILNKLQNGRWGHTNVVILLNPFTFLKMCS